MFCHYVKYCSSKFLNNIQWHLQPVLPGYPFLVPAFHGLSLLCLFLDHFLLRGGQCCLYVFSTLTQGAFWWVVLHLCSSAIWKHTLLFPPSAGAEQRCTEWVCLLQRGSEWEKDFFFFPLWLIPVWPYPAVSSRRSFRRTIPAFQWDQIIQGIDSNGRK